MRKRYSSVPQSEQDHNPSQPNRESRRLAVLACCSPEDTATESPPYPEWPALVSRDSFYTLPTIGAHYQPAPAIQLKKSLEELLIRFRHKLEPFQIHGLQVLLAHGQSQLGAEFGTELKEVWEEVRARASSNVSMNGGEIHKRSSCRV